MNEIPVYLFAGFLDSGKTSFINGVLEDGFAKNDRTLLLCCEEGEEEYQSKVLNNVSVVTVENEEEMTIDFLKSCTKKYRPQQILVEYNGMWPLDLAFRIFPKNWTIYQILTMVDATTFDLYAKNMGQLMMEKIKNADMIVFNRCNEELRDSLRNRNLRMVNRQADIYLENEDGTSEDYLTGDECPFDLTADIIDIPDEDYGVWYVDIMDHPDRYKGKIVHMKLMMCHVPEYADISIPGRFAMVCCQNDITFFGVVARGENLDVYRNRDWLEVTARMGVEVHEVYENEEGPLLNIISSSPCDKPEQEVVSF